MTNEERIRLACSELTNLTSTLLKQSMESMMEIIMKKDMTIEEKTIRLKDLALSKGGYDNITVILYER